MKEFNTLREQALEDSRRRHPAIPEYARVTKRYSDKTANGLTTCIIDFLRFNGHQAERISVTGRYINGRKKVSDCIGRTYMIGSGKWIPGSMQKGSADISSVIAGRAVKWEVKMKDKQSEAQKAYQETVERAGGLYFIVHSFEEFIKNYNVLTQHVDRSGGRVIPTHQAPELFKLKKK